MLLALVGGLILGSVAALALEMFSRPVRDREELLSIFDLPALASLPRMSGRRRRELPPWELDSIGFEQIRMLRVQLSLEGGPVIMLTSAGAGDGKTTVAAALAASFAEVGSSVALIDLDIRKPDLTRVLGVRSIGVTTGSGPGRVPLKIPELPRVQLLPAPAGNLAAFERVLGQLPTMLAEARKISDFVIIDTAPVGEVSETLRIAAHVDQVVFVARPRHTDRRRLQAARDMLRRAGAPVVGMVVVGEDPGSLRGDYAYRYSAELNIARRVPDGRVSGQRLRPDAVRPSGAQDRPLDVLALIDHFVLGGAETLLARFAAAADQAQINLQVACLADLNGNPAAAPLVAAGRPPVNLELPGRPSLHALRAVRRHIAALPARARAHPPRRCGPARRPGRPLARRPGRLDNSRHALADARCVAPARGRPVRRSGHRRVRQRAGRVSAPGLGARGAGGHDPQWQRPRHRGG